MEGSRHARRDDKPTERSDGPRCYCGRPAVWHVLYGSGCGTVCGIHRRVIERRKPGTRTSPYRPNLDDPPRVD